MMRTILDARFLQCGVTALLRSIPDDVHGRIREMASGPGFQVDDNEGEANYEKMDGPWDTDCWPEDEPVWWLPADSAQLLRVLASGLMSGGDGCGKVSDVTLTTGTDPRNGRLNHYVEAVAGDVAIELTRHWAPFGYPTPMEAVLRAMAWVAEHGSSLPELIETACEDSQDRMARVALIKAFRTEEDGEPTISHETWARRVRDAFIATGIAEVRDDGLYFTEAGMRLVHLAKYDAVYDRPMFPENPTRGDALYVAEPDAPIMEIAVDMGVDLGTAIFEVQRSDGSGREIGRIPAGENPGILDRWIEDSECRIPPPGWICTRERGHDGPCAAIPAPIGDATEEEGGQ